jgi:3-oxoacyl-[acyl-carrier-protein] synthase III
MVKHMKTKTFPMPVQIAGIGRYLPPRIVSSAELDRRCRLAPGWTEENQGVRERRWIVDETASFMGAAAAREALADARLDLDAVNLIINGSGTPEQVIPDGACLIQRELGLGKSGIPCHTVHATCLSFMVALDVAASYIMAGRYDTILIVTSDISSCALNFEEPESCTLFGDAAAAVVVRRAPAKSHSAIHAVRLETYGRGADFTCIVGGGTRRHPNRPDARREENLFHMEGSRVLRMAAPRARRFLESLEPGLTHGAAGVDVVVPHQPSKVGLKFLLPGIPASKVVNTLDKFGNCVAASIPITLYEAIKTGRLVRGNKLMLFGTGAGLSLGGIILTY